ncbi:MAG TPA: type II toxin-antitoxin system Phd/YefM family antitoxin [Chthonomonadaceae bacterium]|nr:type II toxin-antitoxin system Phd/YefM family antitoxin [Chthonomonadaceae bacterium]
MIDLRDIHSLSDFQRHTKDFLIQIKRNKNPLVLTVNGKAEVVVQDAQSYQQMLERLERAETLVAVREGREEFERGEGRDAREAFEELRQKHGIPR